jgi:hypothetical protein
MVVHQIKEDALKLFTQRNMRITGWICVVAALENIVAKVKSEELQSVYERISSDQIITASEYSEFINKSLSMSID